MVVPNSPHNNRMIPLSNFRCGLANQQAAVFLAYLASPLWPLADGC